jgi:hypothetical protein
MTHLQCDDLFTETPPKTSVQEQKVSSGATEEHPAHDHARGINTGHAEYHFVEDKPHASTDTVGTVIPFKWVSLASETRGKMTSMALETYDAEASSDTATARTLQESIPLASEPLLVPPLETASQEARDTLDMLASLLREDHTEESKVDVTGIIEHALWVSVGTLEVAEDPPPEGSAPQEVFSDHKADDKGTEASHTNPHDARSSKHVETMSMPMKPFYPLRHIRHQVKQRWLSLALAMESPLRGVTQAQKPTHYVWLFHKLRQRQAEWSVSLVVLALWLVGAWQALFHTKAPAIAHASWQLKMSLKPSLAPLPVLLQEEPLKTTADFQSLQTKLLEEAPTDTAHVHDVTQTMEAMQERADNQHTYTVRVGAEKKRLARLAALKKALQERLAFRLTIPVRGLITSHFGHRWGRPHLGLDVSAPVGSNIMASEEGIVTKVHFEQGYGLTVELRHAFGLSTRYAHCQQAFVRPGQRVQQGQLIAAVGMTGRTTGPHVHFEVKHFGHTVDPERFLGHTLATIHRPS